MSSSSTPAPPRRRMLPIGEKRAQRGYERQRLVEHHVMLGLRDFYDGRRAAQKVEHVFADLGRQQHGALAAEDGDAARGGAQTFGRVADGKVLPNVRIDFPAIAAFN